MSSKHAGEIRLIVAMTPTGGIGLNGEIPWLSREDLKFFYEETTARVTDATDGASRAAMNAVVMGRVTWESLPKTLRGRLNIVVSPSLAKEARERSAAERVARHGAIPDVVVADYRSAICTARDAKCPRIFVIGGVNLFAEALGAGAVDEITVTHVLSEIPCDRWFPLEAARRAGFDLLLRDVADRVRAFLPPIPMINPPIVVRRYRRNARDHDDGAVGRGEARSFNAIKNMSP